MKQSEIILVELRHLDILWMKCFGIFEINGGITKLYIIHVPEFTQVEEKIYKYYPVNFN